MEGQTSMLLCAKAMFLTSSQLDSLCRSEKALLASLRGIRMPNHSELMRLLVYVEKPEKCSAREAFSLLRSF